MRVEALRILMSHGLGAVGVGTFLEGETVLLAAGALCSKGMFPPGALWGVATLGAWLGHVVWFSLGRRLGQERIVELLPRFRDKITRASALIGARPRLGILVLQYLYGFRMAGSVAFGASGLSVRWFLTAQVVNCGTWAAVIMTAGYVLGESTRYLLCGYTCAGWAILALVLAVVLFRGRNP